MLLIFGHLRQFGRRVVLAGNGAVEGEGLRRGRGARFWWLGGFRLPSSFSLGAEWDAGEAVRAGQFDPVDKAVLVEHQRRPLGEQRDHRSAGSE